MKHKTKRGFAAMDPEKHRDISQQGGLIAQKTGKCHRFTSDTAKEAGRKGGLKTSQDREFMAEIGRKGRENKGKHD